MAQEVLRTVRAMPGCQFWGEPLSYTDADLRHVRGHRQVSDAYLAALAASEPDAALATMDERLAQDLPGSTILVPAV